MVILVVAVCGKYPVGLPIGGTNSAVISAACHIQHEERGDDDMTDRPLKWGVTMPGSEDTAGHRSFGSMDVTQPEVGHLYVGCALR